MSHMSLYRASDVLMKHREVIETRLFSSLQTLFDLEETVTLYDLTNTYFEGEATGNRKARRGRSKEKRSDCPLVTLGLVLDGSGFVRRSQTFAGNVSEPGTLAGMLAGTGCSGRERWWSWTQASPPKPTSPGSVEHGYRYLVVRRGGHTPVRRDRSVTIETASEEPLHLQKELSQDGKELPVLPFPESPDQGRSDARQSGGRFEAGLQQISEGLKKPRCEKRHDKLLERLGRLKQKSRGASQHYR
jgi:hypothetical protein